MQAPGTNALSEKVHEALTVRSDVVALDDATRCLLVRVHFGDDGRRPRVSPQTRSSLAHLTRDAGVVPRPSPQGSEEVLGPQKESFARPLAPGEAKGGGELARRPKGVAA